MRSPIANIRTLIIPAGAGPTDPRVVIGPDAPSELRTYYATGAPLTINAPETVVSSTISYDGQGNYAYEAIVIDASATRVTSLVRGAYVGGTVTESERFELNPSFPVGGGQFITFVQANNLILNTGGIVDPTQNVLASATSGDNVDRFGLTAGGALSWGPGGNTAPDTVLYRDGTATLAADVIKANVGGVGETWHTPTLAGTWADVGGAQQTAEYRLMPDGTVWLAGDVKTTGNISQPSTITTLPAGYRPGADLNIPTIVVLAAGNITATINIKTTGVVELTNFAGSVTVALLGLSNIRFPLSALT